MTDTPSSHDFKQSALDYHRLAPRGKIKVVPTKPMLTQRDLALAYSPGVAYACEAIVADPNAASELTARGNLVAVITNGTAVLGLGDIGPLAGKPVMEGKGCLFKKFAGIDVFDIELAEKDPKKLVEIIGPAHTRHLMFTGQPIDARRALEIGMVHQVVGSADLEAAAYQLAQSIARNAPLALAGIKATILRAASLRESIPHADLDEASARARQSADASEGRRAMLEKRRPIFRGE